MVARRTARALVLAKRGAGSPGAQRLKDWSGASLPFLEKWLHGAFALKVLAIGLTRESRHVFVRMALLLVTLAPIGPMAAGVYKCTNADGRVNFSDSPCTSTAEAKPASGGTGSPTSSQPSAKQRWPYLRGLFEEALAGNDLRKKCILLGQVVRLAGEVGEAQREGVRGWNLVDLGIGSRDLPDIEGGEISIGMTRCAVYAAWGDPAGGISKGGITEQWVYQQTGSFVYLKDGVVTAIRRNEPR